MCVCIYFYIIHLDVFHVWLMSCEPHKFMTLTLILPGPYDSQIVVLKIHRKLLACFFPFDTWNNYRPNSLVVCNVSPLSTHLLVLSPMRDLPAAIRTWRCGPEGSRVGGSTFWCCSIVAWGLWLALHEWWRPVGASLCSLCWLQIGRLEQSDGFTTHCPVFVFLSASWRFEIIEITSKWTHRLMDRDVCKVRQVWVMTLHLHICSAIFISWMFTSIPQHVVFSTYTFAHSNFLLSVCKSCNVTV